MWSALANPVGRLAGGDPVGRLGGGSCRAASWWDSVERLLAGPSGPPPGGSGRVPR